ncbi:dolichyl-P-Man:Man(5)GlcNAc(2)-PP-dolichol alpha-1,3-mannosyltransferase [Rhizophlyctis rosea]|uniref:Dol-P-Man:Man(5)GlcNAc(2)-PP-Dol alpha-1,3-mannosyltransferase n=1 Tax=Rhizophlyctis rosea TaxID=64517 RepID=A0AAD5SNV0_9FUNG|nr:dolichyl-P-Man:Man(5)GlcNAc(2)-PP-dolichol alpha-1,3-mannosyltransferase [Rhizophlyctis rosea]
MEKSANGGSYSSLPSSKSILLPLNPVVVWIRNILLLPRFLWLIGGPLLFLELLANLIFVWKVPYTEIDWKAYMQEVEGFIGGERDYLNLKGDTGPLVYPAGFVYIFTFLYRITDGGENIKLAQYIYVGLYLLTLAVVYELYKRAKIPPYVICLLSISKRLHSIYALRLFNDPVAMLPLYICILLMIKGKWTQASVAFSAALSIKMNILLFAPGFAFLVWQATGLAGAITNATIVLWPQLLLALPFLLHAPMSYFSRAFEFRREFLYQWTVNWRFMDEVTFRRKEVAVGLLVAHLASLALFVVGKWARPYGGLGQVIRNGFVNNRVLPTANQIMYVMFTSNLVGITFARSLHYQFFSWYWHTLPFLLWRTSLPVVMRLALLIVIELCWNVFPSTTSSSATLFAAHGTLLLALLASSGKEKA